VIEGGNVYVARGDADLVFTKTGLGLMAMPAPAPASAQHLWHPSVTRMVESAMNVMPPERLIGVQLTGMGDDGAKAMANLRTRGGRTIAQDEASCVVFGMPGELVRMGGADVVLPARGIPNQLLSWLVPAAAMRTSVETRYGSR
jgi:two-component system chemotaxis response regulator CheB